SVIRQIREGKKMSRRALAEKSGITQQTILNVEQNRFPASLSTLAAITDALGISFNKYVELSHRCKTVVLDQNKIKPEPYSGYSVISYEYNDYILLHLQTNEGFQDVSMSQMPYFDVITYVLQGKLDIMVDGESYTVNENQAMSYSGLANRAISSSGPCNIVSILRRKNNTNHHYNPMSELAAVLESYEKMSVSKKPSTVNSDNMDFTILKQLRLMHNMSLEMMSEESGMSTSAISLIENNKRAPSMATLSAIASVLGDTPVNLFQLARKCPTKSYDRSISERALANNGFMVYDTTVDNIMFNFVNKVTINEFGQLTNHPFCMEVQIPVTGSLAMEVDGVLYPVKPGQVLAFDGSRSHKYKMSDDYTGLMIRIPKNKTSSIDNLDSDAQID
ncbi:MAG: transcriptional regulator, partial [Sedimentisphaerales bacterium]|nr:transcriptional regulator [Sedimentisphaerales bacterium]